MVEAIKLAYRAVARYGGSRKLRRGGKRGKRFATVGKKTRFFFSTAQLASLQKQMRREGKFDIDEWIESAGDENGGSK